MGTNPGNRASQRDTDNLTPADPAHLAHRQRRRRTAPEQNKAPLPGISPVPRSVRMLLREPVTALKIAGLTCIAAGCRCQPTHPPDTQ